MVLRRVFRIVGFVASCAAVGRRGLHHAGALTVAMIVPVSIVNCNEQQPQQQQQQASMLAEQSPPAYTPSSLPAYKEREDAVADEKARLVDSTN